MTHCYTFSKHTHKRNQAKAQPRVLGANHHTGRTSPSARWKRLAILLLPLLVAVFMPEITWGQIKQDQPNQPKKITFDGIDATKTYPEGNQITYVLASNLPTDKATVEALQKHIVSEMRVTRIFINPEYNYFMFDGDADVNPQHIVDEMNDFMQTLYGKNDEKQEKGN